MFWGAISRAGGGQVGDWSALTGAAPFPLLYCPVWRKVRNKNCYRGCEGKLIQRSQFKVDEGGFPRISALGYIIISKVKI